MAEYTGSGKDFHRYVGPFLRNLVQQITRKHRDHVGACEHCGSTEKLHSAHVRGRERRQIIDSLLTESQNAEESSIDLIHFEKRFRAEHQPLEKSILILCEPCHRKYDAVSDSAAPNRSNQCNQRHKSIRSLLPITLEPSDPNDFKRRLIATRRAELIIHYSNGRIEIRPWLANRFKETSNLFGNLRSRAEFRSGQWEQSGIVKLHVKVLNLEL